MVVRPFMDNDKHGVFATRAPKRPNPIGISIVKLIKIKENILSIEGVDVVDKTPLLDIKPYVPDFDIWPADKIGWFSQKADKAKSHQADERFTSCYDLEKFTHQEAS